VNKKRIRIANQLIRLNHYLTEPLEFFKNVKMTIGAADSPISGNVRDMNYFN